MVITEEGRERETGLRIRTEIAFDITDNSITFTNYFTMHKLYF